MSKNNIWRLKITIFMVLISLFFHSSFRWFADPLKADLDPDEVAWMLDAEAFSWVLSGNWTAFRLTKPYSELRWADQQYRVIDQPQFGKYLIGAQLTLQMLKPWELSEKLMYYHQFTLGQLPKGNLYQLEGRLDSTLLASIKKIRWSTTVVAFLAICLAAAAVSLYGKNVVSGLSFALLLLNHQTLYSYYRLAIVNAYSFLVQLLAVAAMVYFFKRVLQPNYQIKSGDLHPAAWGAGVGFLVATAISIKLDGVFVLLGIWVWYFIMVVSCIFLFWFKKSDVKNQLHMLLFWLTGFSIFFVITFLLLEPEILVNGSDGLVAILGSRLAQQERFSLYFADLNWLERLLFILRSATQQPWYTQIILLIATASLVYRSRNFRYFKWHWQTVLPKTVLSTLLLLIFLGSLYTTRVGFDRYAIPAVVVLYLFLVCQLPKLKLYG